MAPPSIRGMSDIASGGAPVEPSSFKLRTGACLPAVGLGTYQIKGEAGYKAVLEALKLGYRHIDTAAGYRNERNVGEAMRDSGIPREDIFVQSKLAPKDQGSGVAYNAVMDSLNELGLDYIDSYLIHWPGKSGVRTEDPVNRELRHESYRDLQKAHQEGKVRAIGVSNFNQRHLEGLLDDPSITVLPAINQVELHPYYQQRELRAYCKEHGILIQAYSSLGQLDMSLKEDDVVKEVAAAVNKSPAQVLLRWALEHGTPVIPKSTNPARMAENLSVLDFRLPAEAVTALDTLDRGRKFAWDPRDVA